MQFPKSLFTWKTGARRITASWKHARCLDF